MRNPLLTQTFSFVALHVSNQSLYKGMVALAVLFLLTLTPQQLKAQCQTSSGQIKGNVFVDRDYDGLKDANENSATDVVVFAFDENNAEVASAPVQSNGTFVLNGLTDGEFYRINVQRPDYMVGSFAGPDHHSDVRVELAPNCDVDFAVANPADFCDSENPGIAVTCFVKGGSGINDDMPTVVSTPYLFNIQSPISKIANKGETGSVFGTAWKSATGELFSAAFVKQDAFLKDGPDAIYVSSPDQQGASTNLWLNLSSLGVDAGTLSIANANSCNYGAQVGKLGIGGIEISSDEKHLLAVNLYNKSIVVINMNDPQPSNTIEIPFPMIDCDGGELRPFTVKEYKGKWYVTATCDASVSQDKADHKIAVYSLDIDTRTFEEEFSTTFTRDYWLDSPSSNTKVAHWLTDLEFTKDGHMVLGIADRQSHRYCHASRDLINQFPDVLLVWNDNGTWKLENNGRAGSLTGSGVNNGQGPGGGEFFGEDYWILGPLYHPETATGALYSLPGSDDVVCTVFDPQYSTFSGGFHRYSTTNGRKTGVIELYTNNTQNAFGKGSGLGNIIDMCGPAPIQIGNFVWLDENENGIQDAGETPLSDLELSLVNDQCEVVQVLETDQNGLYYFEALDYHTDYYVVVTDTRYQNEKITISNEAYVVTMPNAGSGVFQNDTDSDAEIVTNAGCDLLEGKMVIQVTTSGPGYVDHSFDLGISPETIVIPDPDTFDLALMKEVRTNNPVKLGEMVDFDITIFNQGEVTASEIGIVEYLPAGFEFVAILNPGWVLQNGNLVYNWMGQLAPGEQTTVSISLQVKNAANQEDYINYAEITGAKDDNGEVAIDIDSQPDLDKNNDVGGEPEGPTDNVYEDDGTIDEDDHDPAVVKIFDLALIKTTAKTGGVVRGEDVLFNIELFNQGHIDARDIQIVEYLPEGLALSANDNNGWVVDGNNIITTYTDQLNAGQSTVINVLLTVTDAAAPGKLTNFAEISGASNGAGEDMSNFDFDSSPDKVVGNDNGGQPKGATDNMYLDNGAIDEDDHDPAILEIFDLALRKTVDRGNVESVDEDITYTFTIFNQGSISAKNIEIVDYLPDGFAFDPAVNPNWQQLSSNLLRALITSTMLPGESLDLTLTLRLTENGLDQELTNVGEIASAQNADGDNENDFDSTPDMIDDNDAGGDIGTPTDDMITGNGVDDEDDHDPAVVTGQAPMVVDVSLEKTVDKSHVGQGEEVVFSLVVTNEENTTVGEIRIVDYLPFFLENIDPEWQTGNTGLYVFKDLVAGNGLPADGLKSGESITTTLTARILNGVPPGPILNTAEVASVAAYEANVITQDVDSNADDDPNNDRSNNPKEVTGGAGAGNRPIEDDRGAAEVVVSLIERVDTCTCLNNESTEDDGQFYETIQVTSASDERWYVQEANNIFRRTSPNPPLAPVAFDNDMLTETPLGGGISVYTIQGVFTEATPWYMILRNNFDAIFSVEGGQECRYQHPAIIGPNSVCVGGTEEYEVIPATPGATYDWDLGSGGTIISGGSGPRVMVQWDAAVSGPHQLTVTELSPDNCTAPASINVEIGDQFIYSVSCIQDAQVSLGRNCESIVTPQMLLTGGPYDYEAFNVMLSDEHGHPIPNATLTFEHIGKRIMAKVFNSCTGNSCWSWLTVEDKIGPEIICFNDTVDCTSMGQYPLPVAIDGCDPDPTIHFLNETVEPIDCDRRFIKRVTRTYVAEDMWGNFSDTCTQEIMLRRIVTEGITYPDTFSIATGNPLICNGFPADSNGLPLPEFTGIPMYEDVVLWPEEFYCSIAVDYRDIQVQQIGCVTKFIREWRIVEWYCTTGFNLIRYPQYIEITDTVAPEVICPDVEYIVTNTRSCDADVWIDLPEITDNCSDTFRVDLVYPGGFIEDFKGGMITLPVDTNAIKFRVYDPCYNVDSCGFDIIVEDNTPPVAICDQFTTVGLTDTGIAYIYAQTFDDGSYDNCTLKTMEVKRMDDGVNCGWVADTFGPYVEFCCEDVGQTVNVIFRVTDKLGNENTCMVQVEVQDKIPPQIYCPPNDTISCEFHYDTSDLSQFGQPVVLDNCDFRLTERVVENVDQCREGYIERIFIAEDDNNITTCVQRIYIINETPFTEDDITWPLDLDTTECREGFLTPDLLPDPYGFPQVEDDFCDLVGITYTDHTFPFVSNTEACYKIVRKWKVINWCRFDSSAFDAWTYEQVIKVQNEMAPDITSSCEPIEKCIFDDCEVGYIELFATAMDDCTDTSELRWEYHIDLDSDGLVDYSNEGFGPRIDIARTFRLGEHNVRYVFEDGCGNKTVCTQFFDLVNCKGPTAYCKNGIIVDLIPMDLDGDGECDTEMVEIWAEDLDDNSFHPCDYPLIYSIGRDTSNKAVMFDCDDLGRRELEICVTDPRGYQSCCNTFVIVQDNNQMDCCPRTFDKDCVVPPADVNLTDCMASTDPDDLMSFPMTGNCMVDSVVTTFVDEDGTNGDVCLKIKRTWTVELYLDGIDTVCQFTHCIIIDNEFTEDSIIWPADTLMIEDCTVDLDTSVTGGVPRLRGEYCDYVTIDFSDEQLEEDDLACETYLRTWTVINSCDNDKAFTYDQIITYRNQAPPTLIVPGDIMVSSDPANCSAEVTLPPVEVGECNTGVVIVNDYNGGGANASGEYPVGRTEVTFTATDECGGESTGVVVVVVNDNEPPTLTCPDDLAFDCDEDIDDLDFGDPVFNDNCGTVNITIDTMMDLGACNIGTITRTITATDTSGNSVMCEQTITIENRDPLVEDDITWPMDTVVVTVCDSTSPDITGEPMVDVDAASCAEVSITFMDTMYMTTCNGMPCTIIERTWTVTDSCQFDDMGAGVFNFLQVIEVDGEPLTINCPGDTTITCEEGLGDLEDYGIFSSESECGVATEVLDTIYDLNTCDVGTVTRIYTVTDSAGITLMCSQVITIEIDDPFTEDRITWPQDSVEIGDCDSMVMTGEPIIDTMGISCFDIIVSMEDSMYVDTCDGEPCSIISRKWTVIDSCQLDSLGAGVFCDTQIIVITGGMLTLDCPADTMITCEDGLGDLSDYGMFSAEAECGIATERLDTIFDLNTCDVGTVIRMYTVTDSAGLTMTCSQTITIEIDDPFTEDRITWPQDSVELDECDSLSLAGEPEIDTMGISCFEITVSMEDSMYVDTCDGEPCDVIERKWTVIDSCLFDGMGAGVFCDTQIIVFTEKELAVMCPPDTTLSCTDELGPLSDYGELSFSSTCGVDTVIRDTIFDLNACDFGTITRSILVRDTTGEEVMCSQVITIGNDMPFAEADITWPADSVFVEGCTSTDPDSLMNGRPVIDSAAMECARLSVNFVDSTESTCDMQPCLTIYRDWTVIDSCQLDMMGSGIFTFRQVIEVNDTTPPMFNVMSIDTVVYADTFTCDGDLVLQVSATDCSPNVTITNNSPFADSTGADASGTYPPGVTNFFFYAEDECCNVDSIPVRVELVDTIPPAIRCTKIFRTMFDSIDGVKFFANDPIIAFFDNCTLEGDYTASFDLNDRTDTCRFYNCDSLRMTGLPNLLYIETLYVWDEAGNVDSCDALLQVVDSSGCTKSFTGNVNVTGLVSTETDTRVRDVEVEMTGTGYQMDMTNRSGEYQFLPMAPGGTYDVAPGKNDDHLNGVTTKDLVYIQRHLLGKDELPTPYQLIAADINNSGSVSAGDLAQLRRILLGYYSEFPDNTSWRFVDEEYNFPDPKDPWKEVWPESYHIDILENNMEIDFTGIKIGDVTGDVEFFGGSQTRSGDAMVIEYELKDGVYHFYKASEEVINSFQMTLSWMPGEGMGVEIPSVSPMTEDDLGYHSLSLGLLSVASDDVISTGRVELFTIPQEAVLSGFEVSNDITEIMAYGQNFEQLDIVLQPANSEGESYTLYQNRPNPFKGSTVIGFDLPFDQTARVSILNVNGQVVYEQEQAFDRGYNEVEVSDDVLQGSGIYYYRLDCEGYSKIMKMINID